jgi:phenylpropionate dioxygenase-like ring-hydroxylating dioxygenase large terminal subunit
MYINFWYPAIASKDLSADQPARVQMLGQQFVLFRDANGQPCCLSDTCVHRGGALGQGKMRDGNVACPYHGWRFDGSGRCVQIPSMGADAKVPARAKVDAYPVEEKYGIIFAFLGDLPEAERPPLMECPEYGTEGWRANLIIFDVSCSYERSIENGMDPAHNEFVHPTHGYHGEREDFAVPEIELEQQDWGCGFTQTFQSHDRVGKDSPTRSKMRTDKDGKFQGEAEAGTWHYGPAAMLTKIHMATHNWMHQYMYECPIDDRNIRVFLVNMRNCVLEPTADKQVEDRCKVIAGQDIEIVEALQPTKTPPAAIREVIVAADSVIVGYRHWLQKWTELGWRIDTRRERQLQQEGDAVFAIPSPARRTEKNWALDTVPLISVASGTDSAAA